MATVALHRISFMSMMNELKVSPKVHCRDEVDFRNATVIRECAGRFRFGCWIFVGPGADTTWQFDKFGEAG